MNYLALIQARCGSSRLPNKVLMDLEGKTVLERVVERVKKSKLVDETFVVTTINEEDLEIIKTCVNSGIRVFCGSSDDVLDRFYQAAKLLMPLNIVRITADCPLIDPEIIDSVIKKHIEEKADYTSNCFIESFPDGEDVEVFKYSSLAKAWDEASLKSEREHVTPYIKKHDEIFRISVLESEIDYSSKRWTLDNAEDYEFISKIYKALFMKNNNFGMNEVIDFLKNNPELEKINSHIARNEGYQKSLSEDSIIKKQG